MAILPLGFILIVVFLGTTLIITSFIIIKRKHKNFENSIYVKNIVINICLINLSGILFIFYEKIFDKIYTGKWPSLFIGIIIMFYILFMNFIGLIFSIICSKKLYITLINYGVFIIATIITYNLISSIVNFLENTNILSECSSIIYLLILMMVENIFSYLIVKVTRKINNRVVIYKIR
ncbi:MAG: hypothetical protein LBL76_04650 [Treponema sp.]|nr:hypothetical protein [Treponema sp.]